MTPSTPNCGKEYQKTLNDYKKLLDTNKREFHRKKNITTRQTSFKSWQGVVLELFKFDERHSQLKCSCTNLGRIMASPYQISAFY